MTVIVSHRRDLELTSHSDPSCLSDSVEMSEADLEVGPSASLIFVSSVESQDFYLYIIIEKRYCTIYCACSNSKIIILYLNMSKHTFHI